MPTSLPPSVREHFGEPVAENFARWLEESLQERTVRRDEHPDRKGGSTPGVYREVLFRLDVIDERFEQVDRRFEGCGREAGPHERPHSVDDTVAHRTRGVVRNAGDGAAGRGAVRG